MDIQTAALLEKAFARLGVIGSDAIAALGNYYRAELTGEFVAAVALVVLAWLLGRSRWAKELDTDPYRAHELSDSAVFTSAAACVILAVGSIAIILTAGPLFGVWLSPNGYVLSRILGSIR